MKINILSRHFHYMYENTRTWLKSQADDRDGAQVKIGSEFAPSPTFPSTWRARRAQATPNWADFDVSLLPS